MTKLEYRKIIWVLLKNYREDEITSLEILLEEILAVPVPEEGKKTDESKFVVHGTYFPHNDKKKVLE